ncbi:ACP S-malonyltransferase [Brevibacillus sp. NPDC003359]|uniref:ACP S-malonyltransferase n=1 Tax=unclassified Brevibacillus TaxID=2684853 RepID=UPI003675C3C0
MKSSVVFMFSGQGSQYHQMGKQLYDHDRVFRNTMNRLDKLVFEQTGESILHHIYEKDVACRTAITRTLISHPAIFMVEYALAQTLIDQGVRPQLVLGSSLGEFAAAAVSDVLSVEDALACVIGQAKCFEEYCCSGSMLAVLSTYSLYERIPGIEYCTLVSVNYDGHFVISGPDEQLSQIARWLTQNSVVNQLLPVSFAFHSPLIDQAEPAYVTYLGKYAFQKPRIPYMSCMLGDFIGELDRHHFWRVARQPIRFQEAVARLEETGPHVYVDVGPGGTLSGFVKRNLSPHSFSETVITLAPYLKEEGIRNLCENYRTMESVGKGGNISMKAYVFPGQGSQSKGMGRDVFGEYRDLVEIADEVLGYSIEELCLRDPNGQLNRTEYTQPALFVVNALTYYKTLQETGRLPDYTAGHSLGEFNALLAAGVFDFATGLQLVKYRGELMSRATGGGMAAVLGLGHDRILQVLQENHLDTIDIANINSLSQIVLSGPKEDMIRAQPAFERAGASNYVVLNVSGAFHSRYMESAKQQFAEYAGLFDFAAPQFPVISNVHARPYDVAAIHENLVEQITSPVQWTDSIRYIMGEGVTDIVQIGPGTAITKLVQSIQKELPPLVVKNPIHSPLFSAEHLGCTEFKEDYGLKLAYLAGGMYGGISSKEMVICLAKAGMMGFLGTGGRQLAEIEADVVSIQRELAENQSYGLNFLHNQLDLMSEEAMVDMLLKRQITRIEAKGFLSMTPALVRYRVSGLYRNSNGSIKAAHKIIAKCSRPEVATLFMSPAPEPILENLLTQQKISSEQAEWARRMPMADDICAEADSAGYTDGAVALALLPAMLQLRQTMITKHQYAKKIRVGAAGGIGTPEAAAAVFVMGADFILTGSINQCTVEAGTSAVVKDLLQQINVQDTEYVPASEMFEFGGKVQVLKKGLYFPARANKLYELYRQYDSLDEIDKKTQIRLQEQYFKKSFDDIYVESKLLCTAEEIERAERSPKAKMALLFKWYFTNASRLALQGDVEAKVDYQVYCGPALGAFNQWVLGTPMELWKQRHVDVIGQTLMRETAEILNNRMFRTGQTET